MAQADGAVQSESTATEAAVLVLQFLVDNGFVKTARAFKRRASRFIFLALILFCCRHRVACPATKVAAPD